MKVLFVNLVYGTGSTGKIIADIMNLLKKYGNDVKALYGTGACSDNADAVKVSGDFGFYFHNAVSRLTDHAGLYSWAATRKMIREIRAFQPDLIHLHTLHGFYVNYEMLFRFLKEANIPVVWTLHDCAKFGLFHGRCYKWGYFPETIRYPSIDDLIDRKAKATILWCGRFLGWKHPDDVIEVAKRLHEAGCCFKIEMIGTGEMERQLKRQASEAGLLDENVRFLGAMSPEAVRRHMESASICLFTSDRQEGWGAVLNEAMNSGCAVVASDAAGATPYLVNDGVNGSVYHSGNIQELYEKVRRLLENTTMQYSFGKAAYLTITELWNAEVAAKRFLQLSQALLNGTDASGLFANGPCSLAKPLREDWYQR